MLQSAASQTRVGLAVASMLTAACLAPAPEERFPEESVSAPRTAATAGNGAKAAAKGAKSDEPNPGNFGNDSPTMTVDVMSLPVAGNGAPASMDPTPCQVGQFCGPKGPDPDNCGSLRLEQDIMITKNPGNVLLVFDQSGSMQDRWGTAGLTKLQAAQAAVMTAVSSLQDLLTVGAIFFPTTQCAPVGGLGNGQGGLPGGGALPDIGANLPGGIGIGGPVVDPIEGPTQIPFQPAAQFLTAWTAHWAQAGAGIGIGTPMQEAFDRADAALQNPTLKGTTVVVAFTDGQPNCFPAAGAATDLEVNRAATWYTSRKIKTYVVGLPGAQGVDILNSVAVSGGSMQYIVPDDPKALEDRLKQVVSESVKMGFNSCSVNLSPAADPVEKLQMVVEEKGKRSKVARDLSKDAGWTISADGMHVEITGLLCDDAKNGRFDSITFEYGCKDLPELPPPVGPM